MIFIDQLNRKIELNGVPKRIVSLVPSQTELLFDLGLNEEVVGITKFCVHPAEWLKTKTKVGGTKNYDLEKIKALRPDLIIGNKEENEQQQIEELMRLYPVWMSDIVTLQDAYNMVTAVGTLIGKQEQSTLLKLQIENQFQKLSASVDRSHKKSVAYFIWKKPYMVAGETTFINEMLHLCGFTNVFATHQSSRYPQLSQEDLVRANPQLILLSSEPYPFSEKHIQEFKDICPHAKIAIVDGEFFSWYGSRLLKASDYFAKLIQQLM